MPKDAKTELAPVLAALAYSHYSKRRLLGQQLFKELGAADWFTVLKKFFGVGTELVKADSVMGGARLHTVIPHH